MPTCKKKYADWSPCVANAVLLKSFWHLTSNSITYKTHCLWTLELSKQPPSPDKRYFAHKLLLCWWLLKVSGLVYNVFKFDTLLYNPLLRNYRHFSSYDRERVGGLPVRVSHVVSEAWGILISTFKRAILWTYFFTPPMVVFNFKDPPTHSE